VSSFKVRVKLPSALAFATDAKLAVLADVLVRQTVDRIRAGGDEQVTFAPKADGGIPLVGNGGGPLIDSLRPVVTDGRFAVVSDFVGAVILRDGTVGKGGTLPTIRPKRAKALAFKVGGVMRYAKSVDLPPRPYMRFTPANLRELADVLFGTVPPT
jgi:hypothetical protein